MNALSLFNDWLNDDYYGTTSKIFVPNVDVTETKDSYVLEMDLPGREEKDVAIELNDRVLTISSAEEKKAETEEHGDADEDLFGLFAAQVLFDPEVEFGGLILLLLGQEESFAALSEKWV